MKCQICGEEFEKIDLEDNICDNCIASIIHSEDIPPNEEDFI